MMRRFLLLMVAFWPLLADAQDDLVGGSSAPAVHQQPGPVRQTVVQLQPLEPPALVLLPTDLGPDEILSLASTCPTCQGNWMPGFYTTICPHCNGKSGGGHPVGTVSFPGCNKDATNPSINQQAADRPHVNRDFGYYTGGFECGLCNTTGQVRQYLQSCPRCHKTQQQGSEVAGGTSPGH